MVGTLSVGERQRIEIIRVLLQKPRLLIMDEPTSVLTPQEVDVLFATLRRLAVGGLSHSLHLATSWKRSARCAIAATILRGGKVVGDAATRARKPPRASREMMIGGRSEAAGARRDHGAGRSPAIEAG